MLKNTARICAKWLAQPPGVKQGTLMPDPQLTDDGGRRAGGLPPDAAITDGDRHGNLAYSPRREQAAEKSAGWSLAHHG